MNESQMSLEEARPVARATDPIESWDAAASVGNLRASQEAVLSVLQRHPYGLTDEQLAEQYALIEDVPRQSPSGLRTRRSELVTLKLVGDSGHRSEMTTGRLAIVWRVKP